MKEWLRFSRTAAKLWCNRIQYKAASFCVAARLSSLITTTSPFATKKEIHNFRISEIQDYHPWSLAHHQLRQKNRSTEIQKYGNTRLSSLIIKKSPFATKLQKSVNSEIQDYHPYSPKKTNIYVPTHKKKKCLDI